MVQFSSVQSLSHVPLFVTPRTAARQASLSITNSWSLLKLMSIESVIPSHPMLSQSPPAFNLSQHQDLFQWVTCPMSQFLCPSSIGAWMKPALSFLWLFYSSAFFFFFLFYSSAFVDNHPHSDGLLSFLDMVAYFIFFRQVWWEPFSSWWLWISPLWFIMCWFSSELQNDF